MQLNCTPDLTPRHIALGGKWVCTGMINADMYVDPALSDWIIRMRSSDLSKSILRFVQNFVHREILTTQHQKECELNARGAQVVPAWMVLGQKQNYEQAFPS